MAFIRHMKEHDAAAVAALLSTSWLQTYGPLMAEEKAAAESAAKHQPEMIVSDMHRAHSESFVAEADDGTIVGYAYAIVPKGVLWLDRLHVSADHQGTGVAENLLRAVMVNYIGEKTISLEVLEGNDRAIAFYEKNGFDVAERRSTCGNIEGVPTLVMRRPLPRA